MNAKAERLDLAVVVQIDFSVKLQTKFVVHISSFNMASHNLVLLPDCMYDAWNLCTENDDNNNKNCRDTPNLTIEFLYKDKKWTITV